MHQKDVAALVNTTTSTVTNWEKNRTTPRLYLLPKIYNFLGYNPLQGDATSLGERIKQYRNQEGVSLTKLAKELGVDPGSLAKWEKGESMPKGDSKRRLAIFLSKL